MRARRPGALRMPAAGAALGLWMLAGAPAGASEDAAGAFRQALQYTVRVHTQITEPFDDDDPGAYEGAGFLVDGERGWIVTNAHVVGQCPSEVQVSFADGPARPARKLYVDPFTDVAVLSLDEPIPGRSAARLADGPPPAAGEPIVVFGHPLGMPFTGSRGIVCGYTDQEGAALLQIDASIDNGNSGGPVISLQDGRIVGIATSGAGGDRADSFNFATPMPDVCRILALLRQGTEPCPPVLAFGLLMDRDGRHTMRVAHTLDAERWPFLPGDRILRVAGGEDLRGLTELVSALRAGRGGIPLIVERGGREVTLTARPALHPAVTKQRGLRIDGALLAPLAIDDWALFGTTPRLVVKSVAPGSQAEALAFEAGDVLWSVDGGAVFDLDSLAARVAARPAGAPLALVLLRAAGRPWRLVDWHARELPGEEVRMVGAAPGPAALQLK